MRLLPAIAPGLGLALGLGLAAPATAQTAAPDMHALIGRWQLDPARTHMGRFGPNGKNIVRAPSFSFIFAPEGDHVTVNVYAQYPQPAPTRSTAMIADGQLHGCADPVSCQTLGGSPADQAYRYYAIDPHFFVRVFYTRRVVSEISTYAVSDDGQTFTMMAWSPETPFYQNIQVFTRQN